MKAFELLYGLTEAEITELGIDPRSGPGGDWMANKNTGPAPGGMMPFSHAPAPVKPQPTPGPGMAPGMAPQSSTAPGGEMKTAGMWQDFKNFMGTPQPTNGGPPQPVNPLGGQQTDLGRSIANMTGLGQAAGAMDQATRPTTPPETK